MINLYHLRNCPSVYDRAKAHYELKLPIITDTRKYNSPSVFVAIPGAKVNPLDVIANILDKGCPVVVFERNAENDSKAKLLEGKYPKTKFLAVTDSVTFLQEISSLHVQEWKAKSPKNTIFAISGSNGKTTHKEMLSFMLNEVLPGKIVSTEKNNNNHLGVPLTLLQISDATEFVVLELGSNHPGEIKVLCDIAKPNAGLTTNIGATHLEFFGDEKKVFDEEGYLYYAVKEVTQGKGFFLINLDDPFLATFEATSNCVTYGTHPKAQALVQFLPNGAKMNYRGQDLVATNEHITGKHNKLNLITCLFIANHFYSSMKDKFIEAAKNFKPTKNRSEWIEFQGKAVYLDAYNANPSSMKAALQGFKESVLDQGKTLDDTCVVLGDMNELGDAASQYHEDVGAYLKELGFPHVYFIGRYSSFYQKGLPQGQGRNSAAEFKQEYRENCLSRYSIHFIKGSRSLQLESLFDIT